jgi:hypothetical protein
MRRTGVVFSIALSLSSAQIAHARIVALLGAPQQSAPSSPAPNVPAEVVSGRPAPPSSSAPPRESTSQSPSATVSTTKPDNPRAIAEETLRRFSLPTPIEPTQWASLIAAVDPAHLTRPELKEAYDIYRVAIARLADDPGRRIRQLLPAAYSYDSARSAFVARPSPELIETLALREKAVLAADDATRTLFRALEAATPLERRATLSLERATLLRNTSRREGLLASTSACLGDILPKLRLEPDVVAAIGGVLTPYATNLVRLLEARDRVLRDAELARAQIETQAGTLWRLGEQAQVAATESLLAEIDDREFATELTIRTLHSETLRKLRSILPRRAGRQLVEEWQRVVHPELFDDERILAELVAHVVEVPALESDADAAIMEILDAAYARLELLAEAACAAADRMTPRLLERTQDAALRVVEANIALLNAQQKRRAILRDALARLRGIAGGAPLESLRKFDDLNETLAALDRADRHDRVSLEALAAQLGLSIERGESEPESSGNQPTSRSPSASPSNPSAGPTRPTGTNGGVERGTNRENGRGSRGSRSTPKSS